MSDPKPNTEKTTGKKLEPVVKSGSASVKKQSGLSSIGHSVVSGDWQLAKSFIISDVLIPTAKKAIVDIVTNGIDIILYGEAGHTKKKNTAGRVSYYNYYDDKDDRRSRSESTTKSQSLFNNIIVDTAGEAEDIFDRMGEYLDQYPYISVADMYDLANITDFPFTYNDYGWNSIAGARKNRMRDGRYELIMPPVRPIK